MHSTLALSAAAQHYLELEEQYSAHNYHPLPVVLNRGEGVFVWDVDGKRYYDFLSGYSAVNQGHCHPAIIAAFIEQAKQLTLTSRAFHSNILGEFAQYITGYFGYDKVLPMNTGVEAVETAIKLARRWGYAVKGIEENKAKIIVCANNFHGRTTTVVGFSSEEQYRNGFGPFTPGFKHVPLGDAQALRDAITPNTCAFLLEPIQGEAGILIPPAGYLAEAAAICNENNVLLMMDEIQSGLGRTGKLFAYQHEGISPDVVIIGKALSGGYYPVSAVLSRRAVLGVFTPGDHGSTFGGNPLACAVARAALKVIVDEDLSARSAALGDYALNRLQQIKSAHVKEVRGKGLWIAIELNGPARPFCEALKDRGLLCKETHDTVIRLAPPLIIAEADLRWALDQIEAVLQS